MYYVNVQSFLLLHLILLTQTDTIELIASVMCCIVGIAHTKFDRASTPWTIKLCLEVIQQHSPNHDNDVIMQVLCAEPAINYVSSYFYPASIWFYHATDTVLLYNVQ